MFILIKRSFKLAWLNFTRNMGLSVAAVFVITATLLSVIFALIARDFSLIIAGNVKERIAVSVYFREGVDEQTIFEIKDKLLEQTEVKEVNYISRQKALEIFIERNKDNPVLMAALAEVGNPFPPSLNIKANTPEEYEKIVAFLENSPSRIFLKKLITLKEGHL